MPAYLAVDLGAESGRVLRGDFDGSRITVSEVHRFPNDPVHRPDGLYWDVEPLYAGVLDGIARGIAAGPGIRSVGVDAWGNDFGLLDGNGDLLAAPWHHRTPRTAGTVARLLGLVDADELYAVTGTQFLPITTACQLLAMQGSPALARAEALATMPDLFAARLSGRRVTEQTIGSTSQLWDIRQGRWAGGLIERLGLADRLFDAEVVAPGTPLGPLTAATTRQLEPPAPVAVVAVAGHDTASAVAAVPAGSAAFGYVSCGTWSLVGLEVPDPITDPGGPARPVHQRGRGRRHGPVPEQRQRVVAAAGVPAGLELGRAPAPGYAALTEQAARAPAWRSLVDPDDPSPCSARATCRPGSPACAGRPGNRCRGIAASSSAACWTAWPASTAGCWSAPPSWSGTRCGWCTWSAAARPTRCSASSPRTSAAGRWWPARSRPPRSAICWSRRWRTGELAGLADIREVVRPSFRLRTLRSRHACRGPRRRLRTLPAAGRPGSASG